MEQSIEMTATYCPHDNSLRIYSPDHLSDETYAKVRAVGFRYAPMQRCFLVKKWTPEREDICLELCGLIEDETMSIEERQAEREARFTKYGVRRGQEADQAAAKIRELASRHTQGDQIVVGHQNEREAQKIANRIEKGIARARSLFETKTYWERRARAVRSHAKYKERDDVRYRRIRKIQKELRSAEESRDQMNAAVAAWSSEKLTFELAKTLANYSHAYMGYKTWYFPIHFYPKGDPDRRHPMSIWDTLVKGIFTEHEAAEFLISYLNEQIELQERWIDHYNSRLAYENALLSVNPAEEYKNVQPGGRITTRNAFLRGQKLAVLKVNKKDGVLTSIEVKTSSGSRKLSPEEITGYEAPIEEEVAVAKKAATPPLVNYPGEGFEHMDSKRWNKIPPDMKHVRKIEAGEQHGAYRIRRHFKSSDYTLQNVYLTDKNRVDLPAPDPKAETKSLAPVLVPTDFTPSAIQPPEQCMLFEAALPKKVEVVAVDQLLVTPDEIAMEMTQLTCGRETGRILEPSAGTGAILRAMAAAGFDMAMVTAVELNTGLASMLKKNYPNVWQGDFLDYEPDENYDLILMNPPFRNASDILHVQHAVEMLNPGGVLISICADGPRQNNILKPMAEDSGGLWRQLPENSFQGTGVHTALLQIKT